MFLPVVGSHVRFVARRVNVGSGFNVIRVRGVSEVSGGPSWAW